MVLINSPRMLCGNTATSRPPHQLRIWPGRQVKGAVARGRRLLDFFVSTVLLTSRFDTTIGAARYGRSLQPGSAARSYSHLDWIHLTFARVPEADDSRLWYHLFSKVRAAAKAPRLGTRLTRPQSLFFLPHPLGVSVGFLP